MTRFIFKIECRKQIVVWIFIQLFVSFLLQGSSFYVILIFHEIKSDLTYTSLYDVWFTGYPTLYPTLYPLL